MAAEINADNQDKRKIISSMFPENLTFDGAQHRTTRINAAIRVFNTLKADFGAKNKGKPVIKTDLPTVVARMGIAPRFKMQFISNLLRNSSRIVQCELQGNT